MSLYKLLGVAKTASKQEIKVAYRKLALQFHPDKHAQSPPQAKAAAAAKFRQISSAYETLADDRKRAAYDRNPDNVREARRQPKPRDSSWNSTQSHTRYSSASNDSGGGVSVDGLRRAIRNLTMRKALKMGLHFILWLLRHIIAFILWVIITFLEHLIEESKRKREEERRKRRW